MIGECSGLVLKAARLHLNEDDGVLTGLMERHSLLMSFEENEQSATKIYFPYKVRVDKIRGIVMKEISSTNAGIITVSNETGAMNDGVITCKALDPLNTEYEVYPFTNNVILKDSYVQLESAKNVRGGKVLISMEVTRV